MKPKKDDKPVLVGPAVSTSALSVAERRFIWLYKQHPKMSQHLCRLWAFGS